MDDEDGLLQSVALQNANSILAARQRVELRNEAYLAEAQRLSHTGSFGWSPSRGELQWSDETFRIFGYDGATRPTVERVLERVHPDDAARVRSEVERASEQGIGFDHAYRLLMPDGAIKHVHIVARAVRSASGVIEFVGAVMDVTEQRTSKAALERAFDEIKKSEDRLRLVINTIPGLVWSGLPDGSFDFINEPWLRYLGCTWEELSARGGLASAVHPDDIEASHARWSVTRTTGRHVDHELRMRRADGQYRWFLTRALPLHDDEGNIVRWYGTATDIEDRKRAEKALQQSEEQWRDVFSNNPTMYFMVDSAGMVLAVNPFGAEQLGYEVAELTGQSVLSVFHESDRTAAHENIRVCFDQLGRARSWEARKVRKDGEVILVRETAKAVPRSNGPIVLIACEDITEQKRASDALRQAQSDLAHVSRVTTMGELTASLAHEVNQPIAASLMNANACLRWLGAETPNMEEARAAASRIVNDATRAGEIVSRIRRFFEKGPPQREAVDVNEVIREMLLLLRNETSRFAIRVHAELADNLPQVTGDRVQLQQVMMNLIMNGFEAMRDVEESRELAIHSIRSDAELLVSVRDTGTGLPREEDRIFDAFFTTKPRGTGMGLSISRSIVESHGGRLWAERSSPRGTIFHVALPAQLQHHA